MRARKRFRNLFRSAARICISFRNSGFFASMTGTCNDSISSRLHWPRIFLFGDSLTQHAFSKYGCWGSLLAENLERKCDVVARGFSGYNTRMCRYVLPRVLNKDDSLSTVAFVLWLGANDAATAEDLGRQHVPLNEYVDNLDRMLRYVKECGLKNESIMLLTPPPFDGDKWARKCRETGKPESKRDPGVVAQYASACASLGASHNVTVVDIYNNMLGDENWKDLLLDGLHLAPSGAAMVASLILPHLQKLTSDTPTLFPDWKDVDREHPEKSLLNWSPTAAKIQ